ncbi:TolA protein [Azospirillum argentinense]|uniref:hypothetical protein n=1 Tax=Azospirillum argentinense TaxID=2970906 RepID=UPI0032DF2ACE
MRKPLIASATLHVALVALFVLGMPPSDRKLDIPESIPIEIVDMGEVTQAARVDKGEPKPSAPKPPVPEAKPSPPAPAPPEPASEPPPPPPPRPEPKVPEPPKVAQVTPPPAREPPPPPKPAPPPPPPDPEPAPVVKPPEPKPEPKPQPPKPEPPKPEPPKPEPPKPEPPKPEPKKPEPPKLEPAKPEPPKPEPKKPEPAKPEPPKAEPKKPEKPPEKTDALADLLKNVQKSAPAKPAASESKADAKPTQHAAASSAPSGAAKAVNGPDKPFKPSGRAIDGIRGAVSKNWNFDPGRKDAGNMQVEIIVELGRDGSVLNATINERYRSRYMSDAAFRASADAALRAVKRASPLPISEFSGDFTPARYEEWRYFVFNFDPRDMF